MTDLKAELKNVFWIGGSPCAGKSSISEILADSFDFDVYHVDEAFAGHIQNLEPISHPNLINWCASSWNERWMKPNDKLLQEVIACYREHFSFVLADILAAPKQKPLLVEGTALLPKQVSALLTKPNRAVWVVPTADFQRTHYAKRDWVRGIVQQCENAETAFQNWMERDARFADWVAAEAKILNLKVLKVDGKHTLRKNALAVARHFELDINQVRA